MLHENVGTSMAEMNVDYLLSPSVSQFPSQQELNEGSEKSSEAQGMIGEEQVQWEIQMFRLHVQEEDNLAEGAGDDHLEVL